MKSLIDLIIKTADKFDESGLEAEADTLDLIVREIMPDDGLGEESRSGG